MLSDMTMTAVDSTSDLRLKLETLKAMYDIFLTTFDLDATASDLIATVKYEGEEMQRYADVLLTLLFEALNASRKAEYDVAKIHDTVMKASPPLPEKEAALRVIYTTFTLEEKRSLCKELHRMTAD